MEIEGGFEDLGNEGVILDGETHRHHRIQIQMLKYKYDLGYEGAVLHETGKTDHHQSSREQSSRLSLHAAGAVDRRPDVFWLEIDPLKKSSLHLEKEPVVGMEEKKEPMMLQAPRAIISWLASRGFPPARRARC